MMTSQVLARPLRRVLPPGPRRRTHHLPLTILAAKPPPEFLRPLITVTIVIVTTTHFTLQQRILPILA